MKVREQKVARLVYNLEHLRENKRTYTPEIVQEIIEVVQDINDARRSDPESLTSHFSMNFVRSSLLAVSLVVRALVSFLLCIHLAGPHLPK